MKAEWKFRGMSPGEINVDPIEGEFFTTEAVGSLTDALVRESIQNSLDASAGEGPVRVCFSFHPGDTGRRDAARKAYMAGLTPHIEARHSGLQAVPAAGESLDYILVEDYGTRGLQGDVMQFDDLEDDLSRNDFYYFWRNVGRSRKDSSDLGRWGLGKTVFQAASRVNAFFGMSVRRDDGKKVLMGQSVLKIHKLEGRRYAPYGYFGRFKGDLALPVEDLPFLERFADSFFIRRAREPGLSIVIPYPEKEIDTRETAKSVIKHYFFPILAGELIVEMKIPAGKYRLSSETLSEFLRKSRMPERHGLLGLLDLTRWAIEQPEEAFERLRAPEPGRAPKLREELFDPGRIEALRERFAEGRRLAFRVPVSLRKRKSREYLHTAFSLFLEKDGTLDRAEDHFIRQGITIPEVSSLRHRGVRAVVYIGERALSSFLGDAENPAHTEWERNSKKFKRIYRLGPSTLDFVKTSPREIVKILTQPRRGRDEDLLKHVFSLPFAAPGPGSAVEKSAPGREGGRTVPEPFLEVNGSAYLALSPVKGGFRLSKRPSAQKVPRLITVWIAYEVRSGNPFKKYTALDFDVGGPPMVLEVSGADVVLKKHNVIQLEVRDAAFKLTVTGFDMHRDLRIKTNP